MALAETAELIVNLRLKDNLTPGLRKVESSLGTISGKIGTLGSKVSSLGGRIKNVLTGPVGLIGLGGALFGLERFLSASITKADEFGTAVAQLSKVTGLAAQETSQLVDTLDYFGVAGDKQVAIAALAEKNLSNLTTTTKEAKKFAADYGLELLDQNGKVKDFNELLLDSADFWNSKTIPAQTKAAALAKIYGRNWKELIPILSQGSQKLRDAEKDAIKLTPEDIENMQKFRDASRKWDDALGDLQITIGAKLLPALTDLANGASEFVTQHSDDIVKFFKDAARFAQQAGAAFQKYVIPAFSAIADAWSKVPPDLKKILIGGFVANKALKATIGVGVGDIAGGIGGALKGILGRGSSPANALWVKSVGGVGGPGGVTAGGGLGKAGTALAGLSILGDIAAVIGTQQAVAGASTAQSQDIHETQKVFVAQSPPISALQNALAGVDQGIKDIKSNPLLVLVQGDALSELEKMRGELTRQIADQQKSGEEIRGSFSAAADKTSGAVEKSGEELRGAFHGLSSAVRKQKPPQVHVNVNNNVSIRDFGKAADISAKYGYTVGPGK